MIGAVGDVMDEERQARQKAEAETAAQHSQGGGAEA